MATYTPNYNLKKPDATDNYNVANENGNADITDAILAAKVDKSDYVKSAGYGIATGAANSYAVTLSPAPSALTDGMGVIVQINVDNTGASSLAINGLASKPLKKSNGQDFPAGALKAGIIYTFRYNAVTGNFILQGEGGGGGTAQPNQVLNGLTFTNDNGQQTGTMTDNTNAGIVITPSTVDQAVTQGYTDGNAVSIKVAGDADLVTGNIKAGVNLFGVTGKTEVVDTSEAGSPAVAANILNGKIAYVNGTKITGTMINKVGSATVITPNTVDQAISQGYYGGATADGKVKGDANLLTANIKAGVTIFGVSGKASVVDTGDATVSSTGHILSGYSAYSNGTKYNGAMTNRYGSNLIYTPSTADQNIYAGYYDGSAASGKVKGDTNLIASNIVNGVSIFGVTGTYQKTSIGAGNTILYSNLPQVSNSTYSNLHSMTFTNNGATVRVKFDAYTTGTRPIGVGVYNGSSWTYTIFTLTSSYATYTCDVTVPANGILVLRIDPNNVGTGWVYAQNYYVMTDIPTPYLTSVS